MGIFAQTQLDWLHLNLPLIHAAPSHDTFRNVLVMIKSAIGVAIRWRWDIETKSITCWT